ncbi:MULTISPECIES: hypothetical protein [unclassified Halorubrum]|jgi:hypothetical protein|uniref:hypothetical protein n=1 Tax=unclassified Halorubrum TaxID=2642239 RepID=UPI0010F8F6D5|nr:MULTISPECIES: hypothetical protein [unclassified Halorubrum]TKX37782.1 hypothetical protein EXE52_14040 [Halorubrum sp. CGM4_25_10-8A]TKX80303.1 hypothetical protein EXE53_11075 [Halorubrum sp. SD626R]
MSGFTLGGEHGATLGGAVGGTLGAVPTPEVFPITAAIQEFLNVVFDHIFHPAVRNLLLEVDAEWVLVIVDICSSSST